MWKRIPNKHIIWKVWELNFSLLLRTKMPKLIIEYRPRLGAANVYILTKNCKPSSSKHFCFVDQAENSIVLAERREDGTDRELSRFIWPEKFGKIFLAQEGNNSTLL